MVNQLDKKDLIIQSLVSQRNNALNALADIESNVQLMQQQIDALLSQVSELQKSGDNISELNPQI